MEISRLGSWALCPCFSLTHPFYCSILKVVLAQNFSYITFLKIWLGFREKLENLPTGQLSFTIKFWIKAIFLLMESLATVKCQRYVLNKINFLIAWNSDRHLPSGVVSLGSRILWPTINIMGGNKTFRVSLNIRATKYCKSMNIDNWPFCCWYTLPVIVTPMLPNVTNDCAAFIHSLICVWENYLLKFAGFS